MTSHGGEVAKTTGDGILALFAGPAQGVRCARQIVAEAEADGLDVRIGLHCGEVERGGDASGVPVHLAARIMSLVVGSQVVVSRTVRDLVFSGSERAGARA